MDKGASPWGRKTVRHSLAAKQQQFQEFDVVPFP